MDLAGLALMAAVIAVVRPIYARGKKIEGFTRQQQGYHANFFALKKLASAIRQEEALTLITAAATIRSSTAMSSS